MKKIGNNLIESQQELLHIKAANVKIAYVVSDQIKKEGKTTNVMAECELIPDKYKWGIDADYLITIYSPNVSELNEQQRQILLFQQLLKISVTTASDENYKFGIRDYDVNDFSIIIKKYGTDWAETQKPLFEEF